MNSGTPIEWTAQLRRGLLELVVLRMLNDEPTYGYALIGKLEALGPLAAGENTVYPLLRRLKTDGTLETYAVASSAGPARQHYRLTVSGRQLLRGMEAQWKEVARAIDQLMGTQR